MSKIKVGIQLYSIRESMEKDMDATLKAVKEMGYDYVEFAGYYGHSAEEVRALLDKHGLECISVHQTYNVFLEDEKKSIDFLKTIGAKYSAVPWMDREKHKGSELYPQTLKEFEKVGKALKENGIQLLYHNHDFEFEKVDGKFLLDWLYEDVPADILKTEIDTCWVHYAGYDPSEYVLKYSGRAPLVHLKDFVCKNLAQGPVYALIDSDGNEGKKATREDNGFEFRPLGYGIQNFPEIIKAAEKAGAEYIIYEQDGHPTSSELEDAKLSREYLKSIGY